jgi:apolipoprotein N-acyltransferase
MILGTALARRQTAARWRMGIAVVAGTVAALGQAPFDFWWATIVGMAVLLAVAAQVAGPWRVAFTLWSGGAGYFAGSLTWIVEPFLVDAARHGWMAPFALIFLAAGLALFWGLAGYVSARVVRYGGARRLAMLILMLSLMELARGYVFTGFPWASLGHVWVETPVAQWAALGGVPFLSLMLMALSGLIALGNWRAWIGAVVVIAVLWGGGLWRLNTPMVAGDTTVRLLQPNAPQHEKWRRDMIPVFYQRLLDFTAAEEPTAPDLIVWPETSVAYLLNDARPLLGEIAEAANGAEVVLGGLRRDETGLYNSAALLGQGGAITSIYDKHHLVPFGEYIPFADLAARFGLYGLAASGAGFASGPGAEVIRLRNGQPVLPLICYEAVFPQDIRAADTRPAWILQITNDAWFGGFSGPYQHLAQARLRAIENGLSVLRSANTGVSAVIDPLGQIQASRALNTAGYIQSTVPQALSPTPYAMAGDWPLLGLILVLTGLCAWMRRNRALT